MPKLIQNQLTLRRVQTAGPGMYCDGFGLYLRVTPGNGRSWVFRYSNLDGRVISMGLGSARELSLAEAREKVAELRRMRRELKDPLAERQEAVRRARAEKHKPATMTFEQALRRYVEDHGKGWVHRHRQNWINSVVIHAKGLLELDVAAIDQAALLRVFQPIWGTSQTVVKRALTRVYQVLAWATAHGHRTGDNPADWSRMKMLLPTVTHEVESHAALPWKELPAFMAKLRANSSIAARAAEFCILTAARSGEVHGALWSEIKDALWVIPSNRMKGREQHTVPLSSRALEILDEMAAIRQNELVFSGIRAKPITDAVKRVAPEVTLHGFRSTIYEWVREATDYPDEMVDIALAHKVQDGVKRAYMRAKMIDRRRGMMEAWAQMCAGNTPAVVVPLRPTR